jgi:hypothetical protein
LQERPLIFDVSLHGLEGFPHGPGSRVAELVRVARRL